MDDDLASLARGSHMVIGVLTALPSHLASVTLPAGSIIPG